MISLSRISTRYQYSEDRICLNGEAEDGELINIWLTRRLADRLVKNLTRWLEPQDMPGYSYTTPKVAAAQLRAIADRQEVKSEAVSKESEHEPPRQDWLVESIEMAYSRFGATFTFKGGRGEEQSARFNVSTQNLQQWLDILYEQYIQADWPIDVWPQWVRIGQIPPRYMDSIVWN